MDGETKHPEPFDILRNRRLTHPRVKLPAGSDRAVVELPPPIYDAGAARFVEFHREAIQTSISKLRRGRDTGPKSPAPAPPPKPAAAFPPLPPVIELPAVKETWKVILDDEAALRGSVRALLPDQRALTLTFAGPSWDPRVALRTLRKFLQTRAQHYLLPLVDELEQRCDLAAGTITVRAQRTRWGSCSAKGNLSLNLTLLLLPHRLVEYVVLHELCHTVELNHADAFWDLLQKHLPDALDRRKELRAAEQQLPSWVASMLIA